MIRWCQAGVFQPRFVIHSWNKDREPTEPWTYPDVLKDIINLIKLHYIFIPYIYNTAIEATRNGTPLQRPLCLEYPEDDKIDIDDFNYLFGPSILVLSALEEKLDSVSAYLPASVDWYEPKEGLLYTGGRRISLEYKLNDFRYFVKAGSIIPTAPVLKSLNTGFFSRLEFLLFPGPDTSLLYYEDDGVTDFKMGDYNEIDLSLKKTKDGNI
ncbi:unnamed protein product, partial [marine sediment metagenome]